MKKHFKSHIGTIKPDAPLWVEVLATPGSELLPEAYAFRAEDIRSARAIGDSHTLLKLDTGTEFLLHMPQPEFMAKLHEPEGPVLDLKPVTVTKDRDSTISSIRTAFAEAARKAKEAFLDSLEITTHIRQSQQRTFHKVQLHYRDIEKMSEGGSIFGGKCLNVEAKPSTGAALPQFIVEMTQAAWDTHIDTAVKQKTAHIDLLEFSIKREEAPQKAPAP